jgi:outer membrane beta-barrel protein
VTGRGLRRFVACALIALTRVSVVAAQTPATAVPSASDGVSASEPPARPSDAPVPSCIDQSIVDELGRSVRARGVQQRDFLKQGQVALTARGGLFAGDLMSSSYAYGGALAYFLTEDLGVEVGFDVSPIRLDLDEPLAEFFGDRRYANSRGYLATAGLLWAPIHAKLKLLDSIVHADLMLAAGAGRLLHDTAQGLAFDGGAVLEMFTTQWITFRLDIRDLIVVQEAASETRLANNILVTAGVSLWLPTGL